jgi:hypothetical protein
MALKDVEKKLEIKSEPSSLAERLVAYKARKSNEVIEKEHSFLNSKKGLPNSFMSPIKILSLILGFIIIGFAVFNAPPWVGLLLSGGVLIHFAWSD